MSSKKFYYPLKIWVRRVLGITDSKSHCTPSEPKHFAQEVLKQLRDLQEQKVVELMLPRTEIIAVRHDASLEEVVQLFIKNKATLLPIYYNDPDDITSFVRVHDILTYLSTGPDTKTFQLTKNSHKLMVYAAKSTKCVDLLRKMQDSAAEMAIILDEYGGIEGLLTMDKLIIGLLSEIKDEVNHERRPEHIQQIDQNTYILRGKTAVQEIAEHIPALSLLDEGDSSYETLAGFILSYLNRMPRKSEVILHESGIKLEILEATPRKIGLVKLSLPLSE